MKALAKLLSLLTITIGCLVILGWQLEFVALTSIFPTSVAMNPLTAVSFILLGISLWIHAASTNKGEIILAKVFALTVLVATTSKIIDLNFGTSFNADQLLFTSKLSSLQQLQPNRMAPNTALNFIMMSLALLSYSPFFKFSRYITFLTSIISTFFSASALIGYIFNLSRLYAVANYIPMAIHTALTFLLLVLGVNAMAGSFSSLFGSKGVFNKFLLNLPIRFKLFFSFGTLLTLFMVFSIFTYVLVFDIQNNQIPVRSNVRLLRSSILEMQRYEQIFITQEVVNETNFVFFESGKSNILDEWQVHYQSVLNNFNQIKEFESRRGINNTQRNEVFESVLATHHDRFLTLVDKYRELGFEDFGTEGKMRAAAHILQEELETRSPANIHLFEARRREKDFLLRKDLQYTVLFDEAISNLRPYVENDPELAAALDSYVTSFQKIVELHKQIGLTTESGLQGEMSVALLELEPIHAKLETTTLEETIRNIENITKSILMLSVLLALTSIGFALYLGRMIVYPIKQLHSAATSIADGDFSKRVELKDTGDETGQLAKTFNTMASQIQTSYDVLEQAKNKDEAILGGIGDGVFAIDANEKIILFNQAAANISGYSLDEALGKPYKDILKFTADGSTEVKDDFIQKALGGENAEMANHTVIWRKDGTQVPVADSAAPIMDANNKVDGVVVVFRDVSKERQLEKLKDEFVSVASHELRTPMTAIKGYISMILDGDYGPVTEELKQPLKDVYASTVRLIDLVNDMLSVSRIEAGRLKIELQNLDAKTAIEKVVNQLQPVAKEKGIVLAVESAVTATIQADPDRLEQVLTNLVGNSLKFTDKGSITISTRITGELLEIAVKDSGIGITVEDQRRLFNKFTQLSSRDAGRPVGTGLGLYITKELAEKMGGDVWIEHSEAGKGSIFIFSVPLANSSVAQLTAEKIAAAAVSHVEHK